MKAVSNIYLTGCEIFIFQSAEIPDITDSSFSVVILPSSNSSQMLKFCIQMLIDTYYGSFEHREIRACGKNSI
jgi:hypothetical protein